MIHIHENQLPSSPFAEGGEGYIYEWEKDKLLKIFKPHIDAKEKEQKTKRLMQKNLPSCVIKPVDLVYNQKKQFIGYAMKRAEGEELKKLSNKKFINVNQIHSKNVLEILIKIKNTLMMLHKQNIYIGDLNDGNVLFDEKNNIFFIDVDSWSVDEFKCNVCMETFKDPQLHQDYFNEKTDAYAFAILVFKSLTRLHPFGGTITPDMNIMNRMIKGISVFDHEVKIPRNVNSWSFFPPLFKDHLKEIFNDGKRYVLDKELDDFYQHLSFCKNHNDYYFDRFNECPVCHSNAKVIMQPIKIAGNTAIPLLLLHQPEDILTFLNHSLYVNKQKQIVDLRTKKTYPYVRNQDVYFSHDHNFIYRIYPDKVEVYSVNTKAVSVFDKIHLSKVIIRNDKLYYQSKNLNLIQVTVSDKGNVSKVLAKTAFRAKFNVIDEKNFIILNMYDNMKIFNVNGYNYQVLENLQVEQCAFHFDAITKRWLTVIETTSGIYHTFVLENNQVIFQSDTLKYHASLSNICFSNNTIFTPQEGFIRGLQVEKFQYKDFPCPVVNEESNISREQKAFLILNEKEIYKFG